MKKKISLTSSSFLLNETTIWDSFAKKYNLIFVDLRIFILDNLN